ncbi:DUF4344 domain-containing metallopeptidase [Devosia neptuniae]|uniref:DUF4344 domain-containing metallopeptidase n=1 Tax=Devosia neptuniae TaxID=191302 RepID=A0ABY6CI28_9HYPH|nr:DUF4344 domain-containing metallopeptidase [Devosia neptuniae]UXN71865.1 DUF4344 domain-containing metallopeptidase [Devosia neptuniae]
MNCKSLVLALGLVALGSATQVWAQDVLGPLAGAVDQQLVKGWQAGEEGGWFVLRNDTLEGSEQTLAINAGPPPTDGREITVNVTLKSQIPEAAIGLLARSATNNDVCLMEITAEAKGNLFCVIEGDFKSIASVPNAARMDGSDIITMVEVPGAARFFINDTQIGDVTYATALGAEIGIMAYERGTFGLADFQISGPEASSGAGLPPKGGSGGTGLPPKGGASAGGSGSGTAPSSGGGSTGENSGGGDNKMAAIMGPLADTINGSDDKEGWQLFFEDNWLVLVNSATASSELVYKMPVGPLTSGERVTSLDIGILPPQGEDAANFTKSAAGILIESSDGSASCIGEITAARDGLVLCFGADGKGREVGRLAGAAQGGGKDVLQFVERPGFGEFRLNGQVIAQLQDDPALGGDIGILAYERGEFYVGGFTISSGAGTASAGTPASSGTPSSGGTTSVGAGVPMFGHDEARLIGVYLGLTNSIFMHEFGHALIGELQIPSTGPEEDSVDIFSALKVVEPTMYPTEDEGINAIGREVATYSALQWYYSGMLAQQQGGGETPWQDEHTPDLKRFRNVFCVMYGGNPAIFTDMAEQIKFDERTLGRCEEEFTKQNRAWRTILAPHTRVDTWFPEGQLPADAPGAKVEVTFEPSNSEIGTFLATTFGDGLRGFADNLSKNYALPRPIAVTYKDCGELNAWYDPREGTITMCYDLIEHLALMISDIEMGTGDTGSATQTQPTSSAGNVAKTSTASVGNATSADELADLGVPVTSVLFPAPYKGPTPASHSKAQILTTQDLAAALNEGTPMLLVDTSGLAETIPGALSVTDAGKDGSLTDRFQSAVDGWLKEETATDAKMPVIFFGRDRQDRSSYNGALRAGALGWNAFWYRGGIEAWQSNGLPLAAVE